MCVIIFDGNPAPGGGQHGTAVQPSIFILAKKHPSTVNRPKHPAGGKGIDRKAAAEINKNLRKKSGLS